MAFVKATLILLAVATSGTVAQGNIPNFTDLICSTNLEARKYEQCVIESIIKLQPYLKTGVPEYNIPSLEPLLLKRLVFTPTSNLRLQAKDILTYGASDFTISKLKIDIDNLYILLDVTLPNLRIEGEYDINGKILLFPLRGSGPFHGQFNDSIGACRIQAEKYVNSEGVEKVRINDFKMKITVGQGSLVFDNLFNGEKVLGDVINTAINNNFQLFLKELLPILEKALSDTFTTTSDNIIKQFTYAQLFAKT